MARNARPTRARARQTRVGYVAFAAAATLMTLFRWLGYGDMALPTTDQTRYDAPRGDGPLPRSRAPRACSRRINFLLLDHLSLLLDMHDETDRKRGLLRS